MAAIKCSNVWWLFVAMLTPGANFYLKKWARLLKTEQFSSSLSKSFCCEIMLLYCFLNNLRSTFNEFKMSLNRPRKIEMQNEFSVLQDSFDQINFFAYLSFPSPWTNYVQQRAKANQSKPMQTLSSFRFATKNGKKKIEILKTSEQNGDWPP